MNTFNYSEFDLNSNLARDKAIKRIEDLQEIRSGFLTRFFGLKGSLFNDAIKEFKVTFIPVLDYKDLRFIEEQKAYLFDSFELPENLDTLKSQEYKNAIKNKLRSLFFDHLNYKEDKRPKETPKVDHFTRIKNELAEYKTKFWNRKVKANFPLWGCEALVISNDEWSSNYERELYIYTKDARIPLFITEMNDFYHENIKHSGRYSLIEVFAKVLKRYAFKYDNLVLNEEIFDELMEELLIFFDNEIKGINSFKY